MDPFEDMDGIDPGLELERETQSEASIVLDTGLSIPATYSKDVLPGLPAQPLGKAKPGEKDRGVDAVIGLFDPEEMGDTLRSLGFKGAEITTVLVDTIRRGPTKERLTAINMLQRTAEKSLKLSGHLQTEKGEITQQDDKGNEQKLTVSQMRMQAQISNRPSLEQIPGGVRQVAPLTKEEIHDAVTTQQEEGPGQEEDALQEEGTFQEDPDEDEDPDDHFCTSAAEPDATPDGQSPTESRPNRRVF